MLLNNQWITKKIKDKIKSYLGTNENESTMVQNLWDQLQVVLRGKFIEILPQKKKKKRKRKKQCKLKPKTNRERRRNGT